MSGCIAFPVEEAVTEKELLPINPDVIREPKPADRIIPITDPKEIEKIKREIPAPTDKPTQLRQDFFPVDVSIPNNPIQHSSQVNTPLKTKRNVQETSTVAVPVPSTLPLHPVQSEAVGETKTKDDVKRDIPVPLEPKHKHAEESEHVHHNEDNSQHHEHQHEEKEQQHTSASEHVPRNRPIPVAELFGRKHE